MRVLLVANTLPPHDLSGVGEQVLQLAAGLEARGHEVRILGRGRQGARGPKLLFPLTAVPAYLRLRRTFRPEVIQVHESDGGLVVLASAIFDSTDPSPPRRVALLQVSYLEEFRAVRPLRGDGRVLGRPGASEWRFKWLKAPLQIVLGCLTAWLADVILAPSRRTAGEIERDYGVRGIGVLPNATGACEIEVGEAEPPPGTPFLLFVGRLRLRKGVEVLLEAMVRLGELADLRLLVAGDGEHRERLVRRADELGLSQRVSFLGRCEAGRVRTLLGACRALVVPSIYEGMPLVVLEAMEAGAPVVASAVSGIPEVVVDGETGWLVPPEEPAELAVAIAAAWRDGGEAARRGAAGRRRLELYRPERIAETWERCVQPAASGHGGAKG